MATLSEKLRPVWRFVLRSTYRRELMAVLSESVEIVSGLVWQDNCQEPTITDQREVMTVPCLADHVFSFVQNCLPYCRLSYDYRGLYM